MRRGMFLDQQTETNHYTRPVEIAAGFAGLGEALATAPAAIKQKLARNAAGAQGRPQKAARSQAMAKATAKAVGVRDAAPAGVGAPSNSSAAAMLAARAAPAVDGENILTAHRQRAASMNPLARHYAPELVASLNGMDGFLDFLKPVVQAVQSVVPSHTIIGKLANGNVTGAANAAVDYVRDSQQAQTPVVLPPPTSIFSPQTETQKYLLWGAAGLGGVLILSVLLRKRSGAAAASSRSDGGSNMDSMMERMMKFQMMRDMMPARRSF